MKTVDEIYSDMKAVFAEKAGYGIDDKSDMAVRMYASAAELFSLYSYNDWVLRQSFPQTADGEYLDHHAEVRGLTRRAGEKARGFVTFYVSDGTSSDRTVEKGTVCYTQYGTRFTVTEDTVIPAGEASADAPCICESDGEAGNVAADTVTYMAVCPVGVIACTNQLPFTGGKDRESDELLRERVIKSYKMLPNGANAAYYEKAVLDNENVAAVKVLPKNRGIGTVDIVFSTHYGMPSSALVDEIQADISEKREICVSVAVSAPTEISVSVEADIAVSDGYSFDDVSERVGSRIAEYFDGTRLGKDVLLAEIADIIYSTDGVENYSIVWPEEDIDILATELPTAGDITVGEMGE